MKYTIVSNDYKESLEKEKEVIDLVTKSQWIRDDESPEYIFVVGGDGTFLKATEKYNSKLDQIIFIPIKSGGIGFYTNHNRVSHIENIINDIKKIKPIEISYIEADDYKVVNEIKILNDSKPLELDIFINNELLETFKGTGVVFTTANGSTGFGKSTGGAVIIDEDNIYQMLEIAPISNNNFRTINAPIILSKKHKVKIIIKRKENVKIIVDGKACENKLKEQISISLSDKKIKLISFNSNEISKIEICKSIFTLNKKYEK